MTVGKKQRAKVLNEGCANKSRLKVTSYIGIGEAFGVLRLWRSFGSLSRFCTDSGTSGSPQFSTIVRVNTRLPKRRQSDTAGEFSNEASPLSSGRSDMFIETAKCDPQAPSGATSDIFRSDGAWGNIVYISINIPRLWRFETRI